MGYPVKDEWYTSIDLWRAWYAGEVAAVHNYDVYNGKEFIHCKRRKLGMGKAISEDWANLEMNEKVQIIVEDKTKQEKLDNVLAANHFRRNMNQLIEKTFALGTGATVEYKDGDATKIDYIRAGMIYPLSVDNGEIRECAFASESITANNQIQVYLNMHTLDDKGNYVIENKMFTRVGDSLSSAPLPDGVQEIVETGSPVPLFQIIKPNIVNNLDFDSPMGISVFANALDQLAVTDLIFDSYQNEYLLGMKRITVPMSMAQIQMEADGTSKPVFDPRSTVFHAVPAVSGQTQKIEEHNMAIRAQEHSAGIQDALNMLSYKCGLGKDRYNFHDGQVKTATEVVSEKSDLFQNLKKHEILLKDALVCMVQAIMQLEGMTIEPDEITINFDDSIIEDVNAERVQFLQGVTLGIYQPWEYRVRFDGEDEETAKAMTGQQGGITYADS